MSASALSLSSVYGPVPAATRGKACNVCTTPAGDAILYGSSSNIVIRQLSSLTTCAMYMGHIQVASVARVSPCGRWVASGDNSGLVRVWPYVAPYTETRATFKAIPGPVLDIAWAPDSSVLMVVGAEPQDVLKRGTWGATIALTLDQDGPGGNVAVGFAGHKKAVLSCDASPRPVGQPGHGLVVSVSEDHLLNVYEGFGAALKVSLLEQTGRFRNCVRFSPDGAHFAVAHSDKKISLYDGVTGELVVEQNVEEAHNGGIMSVSWSSDGRHLASASSDKTVRVWEVAGGRLTSVRTHGVAQYPNLSDQQVGVVFLADGAVVSISLSGNVNLHTPASTTLPARVVSGHGVSCTAMAHHAGSRTVATGGLDGSLVLWRYGERDMTLGVGHAAQITGLLAGPDHVITISMDSTLAVLNRGLGATQAALQLSAPPVDIACANNWLHAGLDTTIAVATQAGLVVVRQAKIVAKVDLDKSPQGVCMSPQGNEIAVACSDGIHVYDLQGDTLDDLIILYKHKNPVVVVQYSPDGTKLASGDAKGDVFLFNRDGYNVIMDGWEYHAARVTDIAWTPDSKRFLTSSLDGSAIIWNPENVRLRVNVEGLAKGGVTSAEFIDERTVATVGHDGCLRFWDANL